MNAIDMLLSRTSVVPAQLAEPGPSDEDLAAILDAGLRAPDHGRLRPWRFAIVRGPARAALGELLASAARTRVPPTSETKIERYRTLPLLAPVVIAVGAKLVPDHPVPVVEQLLSVGAAAMNLLNAAHALGFGGIWLTGPHCYDPAVAEALGFKDPGRLVGFLYIGSVAEASAAARPDRAGHVWEWTGE
jgi:nitroreductase